MVLGTYVTIAATPVRAYASDGFLGGLQDLVGTREVEFAQDYESEYIEDYSPDIGTIEPVRTVNRDGDEVEDLTTPVDEVNTTIDYMYNLNIFGVGRRSWLSNIQLLFLNNGYLRVVFTVGAGFVFMWWGVRKCIQMVMSGFRKGSMNV